ncbi:MAG: DUF799 family lipoprotein [Deltaproteobacteria bacterium]|nr:DUF799 family lipoprotein [Deltaproteobacteria bacterium]
MQEGRLLRKLAVGCAALVLAGCATTGAGVYHNQDMDFGSIQTVAVMPLANLSRDVQAAERVRDVLTTQLLATGAFYVLPPGEVAGVVTKAGIGNPAAPSADQIVALCSALKADAVLTGVVREYGDVRSGSATANVISLGLQMSEGQTGKVVWSASSTQGGIGWGDRLFGGGGEALNVVTEKAVNELIKKLFE